MSISGVQRNTIQRTIILESLRKMRTHPTIEELHVEVSKIYPTISKTTMYRNLRILAQNGLVLRILLPDGLERYDGSIHGHFHFQCSVCKEIFDIDNIDFDSALDVRGAIQNKYDFVIKSYDILLDGYCRECNNEVLDETDEPV